VRERRLGSRFRGNDGKERRVKKLYEHIAGSHLGSSALFGGAFFASDLMNGSVIEAAATGAVAAASWLASLPLLKRIIGAAAGA
jgi:hypothetical protein